MNEMRNWVWNACEKQIRHAFCQFIVRLVRFNGRKRSSNGGVNWTSLRSRCLCFSLISISILNPNVVNCQSSSHLLIYEYYLIFRLYWFYAKKKKTSNSNLNAFYPISGFIYVSAKTQLYISNFIDFQFDTKFSLFNWYRIIQMP